MPFDPDYQVPETRRAYVMTPETPLPNGRVGCLMLHGFMGSPTSSRAMARFLADHGIEVHCPLLPGHGNLPYMLRGSTLAQWLAEAEEAYQAIQTACEQVFVMGHSMGAVLAATLVKRYEQIRGMIMLAPLYDVPDRRIKLAGIGRFFTPWFYPLKRKSVDHHIFLGRVKDFDPTIDVEDPSLQAWLVEATRLPMDAIWQMVKAAHMGQRLWQTINVPTLILQGEKDPAVSPGNAHLVHSLIPHPDKLLITFPNTGHELMRPFEPVHQTVWQQVLAFIQKQMTPVDSESASP